MMGLLLFVLVAHGVGWLPLCRYTLYNIITPDYHEETTSNETDGCRAQGQCPPRQP